MSQLVPYQPLNLAPLDNPLLAGAIDGIKPPFLGTVSEWITENVVMPFSARSTRFDPTVSPQWVEPLNLLSSPRFRVITMLMAPGSGKTGAIECGLSYAVVQSPGDTGIASQTNQTTEYWAETRLKKVFENSPAVAKLLPKQKDKIKKDAIHFPHMNVVLGGANLTNFQEKSLQWAWGDEVWTWGHGLVKQFETRLHDRWNGKLILMSQGGYTHSELEQRFLGGDQRYFGFTCPECNQWNRFTWSLFKYEKLYGDGGKINWGLTEKTIRMVCPTCSTTWNDTAEHRRFLCNRGSYKATNPDHVREWASFQCSSFGVWQIPWGRLCREWIEANSSKEANDLEPLRLFIMQRMVEFADAEIAESLDSSPIWERREEYTTEALPNGILYITGGTDVQEDRLEVTLYGWGKGMECWAIEHKILLGNTTQQAVWDECDEFLEETYTREDGTVLTVSACGFDTGNNPDDVYKFTKPRIGKKFYALKGSSIANKPIASRPIKSGVVKARLWMVGTDTAKTRIYGRLRLIRREGNVNPGYIHYPKTDCFDETFFKQLTSEKVIIKVKGSERIKVFQPHGRNEALDCCVYALAAYMIANPKIDRLAKGIEDAKKEDTKSSDEEDTEDQEPADETPNREQDQEANEARRRSNRLPFRRRRGGGWV